MAQWIHTIAYIKILDETSDCWDSSTVKGHRRQGLLRRIHELLDTDKDGIISARQALRGLREINDFHLSDMEARFTISILEALSSMPFDSAGVTTVAGLIEDFDVSYCMYPLRHTLSTAPHTCRKRGN